MILATEWLNPGMGDEAGSDSQAWNVPDPFVLYRLSSSEGWQRLVERYERQPVNFDLAVSQLQAGSITEPVLTDRPFLRCLEVARLNSARTAIVETRYIDADYRSEYSLFYSKAFAHYEDSAHRIHFFEDEITEGEVWRLPPQSQYLGYLIVRPDVRCLVGRTMLRPPPELREHVRTAIRESVDFFGQKLTIRAAPFMQQDSRLDSCAQAAAWMCHYTAYRRADRSVHRRTIGEFTASVDPGLAIGRPIPSTGLSLEQLTELLTKFGLPPVVADISSLDTSDVPPNRRSSSIITRVRGLSDQERSSAAIRICCRYLNSGIPVIAILRQWRNDADRSDRHAVVVCGYSSRNGSQLRLIINDDSRGPYLNVQNILRDSDEATGQKRRWDQLIVPLPEKLWMTGSSAERRGLTMFLAAARRAASANIPSAERALEADQGTYLGVRTYFATSNRFKERLRERCQDPVVIREYALTRLPRFVWVVEALDLRERERARIPGSNFRGIACVLGEVVFDATSDDFDPTVLAIRVPGLIWVRRTLLSDSGTASRKFFSEAACGSDLIVSGGVYDP